MSKTFDDWSAMGARIRRGEHGTKIGGKVYFESWQVWYPQQQRSYYPCGWGYDHDEGDNDITDYELNAGWHKS